MQEILGRSTVQHRIARHSESAFEFFDLFALTCSILGLAVVVVSCHSLVMTIEVHVGNVVLEDGPEMADILGHCSGCNGDTWVAGSMFGYVEIPKGRSLVMLFRSLSGRIPVFEECDSARSSVNYVWFTD